MNPVPLKRSFVPLTCAAWVLKASSLYGPPLPTVRKLPERRIQQNRRCRWKPDSGSHDCIAHLLATCRCLCQTVEHMRSSGKAASWPPRSMPPARMPCDGETRKYRLPTQVARKTQDVEWKSSLVKSLGQLKPRQHDPSRAHATHHAV